MSETLPGVGVTPLSGLGTARWYRPDERPDPESIEAAAPDTERERFSDAQAQAREEIETEREHTAERVGEEEAAVFDAHLQFLDDPQITDGVDEAIEDGAAAEAGVARAYGSAIEQFEGMEA